MIHSRHLHLSCPQHKSLCGCAGQSQPPNHLSMFLEVTEPQASAPAWSYFVSHRLSVVNKDEAKNVTKESQNRHA